MKLVFASNNTHKLEEVRAILTGHDILNLKDIGFTDEIDETGDTLEANSLIKARVVQQFLEVHPSPFSIDGIFSDDTGLEIHALGDQPGVCTARWAGEPAVDSRNRAKALQELKGISDRQARFRTVITLIRKNTEQQVEGIVTGQIAEKEIGEGGFGYDPIFIPEGYDKTFAQLPAETKNTISHRARAMEALRDLLENQ